MEWQLGLNVGTACRSPAGRQRPEEMGFVCSKHRRLAVFEGEFRNFAIRLLLQIVWSGSGVRRWPEAGGLGSWPWESACLSQTE